MSDNPYYATESELVRCKVCGTTVSTALTVCPTCGNDIRPQKRSYYSWSGIALLIILFALALLIGFPGTDNGLRQIIRVSLSSLDQLAKDFDPRQAATLTPESGAIAFVPDPSRATPQSLPPTRSVPPFEAPTPEEAVLLIATATTSATAPLAADTLLTATLQATDTPIPTATAVATDTPAPTATVAATDTATPTETPAPTETATPSATDTPPPTPSATELVSAAATTTATPTATNRAITVRTSTATATRTQASEARAADLSSELSATVPATATVALTIDTTAPLTASAPISESEVLTDLLSLLAPTPTLTPVPATPTATDTATPANLVYTVRTGDTLVSIAARYQITLDELMLANGYGQGRATVIRPGQQLIIPNQQQSEAQVAIANTPTPPPPPDTATATPSATATTAPTTPLSAPLTYVVRSGDTPMAIARRFDISVNELLAANGLTLDDATRIRVGQTLRIPGVQATANSTVVPATEASQQTYTVQAGDTPVAIAARYGISVNALLAANGLTSSDATRIRVGQVLIIPGGQAPAPTATPTRSSATSAPPVAEATNNSNSNNSGQTTGQVRLDAPRLRSPENGTKVSCTGTNRLIWEPVSFILDTDNYLIHLGYVSGVDSNGAPIVTWVLRQVRPATDTLWTLDTNLCALTPANYDRQWRWYVEVIDTTAGNAVVSAPGAVYSFRWE